MSYSVPDPEQEVDPRVRESDRELDENQAIAAGATGSGAADEPRDDGDTTHTTGKGPTSVDEGSPADRGDDAG